MKTLKFTLLAGFALAASFAVRAATPAQNWLETYYQHPRADLVPRMIQTLSYQGYFEDAAHRDVAIGFLATVFRQNPDRIGAWRYDFARLPLAGQRLVAAALWQAGNPLGSSLLRELAAGSPVRAEVEQLAATAPAPVTAVPVRSVASMNLQWGAFLASGDERDIVAILHAIGTGQPGLDAAARYSLAQNAASHPRVLEICRDQLSREPDTAEAAVLRDALRGAGSAPRS